MDIRRPRLSKTTDLARKSRLMMESWRVPEELTRLLTMLSADENIQYRYLPSKCVATYLRDQGFKVFVREGAQKFLDESVWSAVKIRSSEGRRGGYNSPFPLYVHRALMENLTFQVRWEATDSHSLTVKSILYYLTTYGNIYLKGEAQKLAEKWKIDLNPPPRVE